MDRQLWARKPASMFDEEMKTSGLRRVLGKWGLTSLGVGAIIGAGIFVLTGLAAREYAGPALALSFVISGVGCAFAALCYAEFASMLPVEGSAYAYSYATMGELFAWIIGWDLILEYSMASSSVAVGWSGYLGKLFALFNIHLPFYLMHDLHTATALIAEATQRGELAHLASHYSSLSIPTILGMPFAMNLPAFLIILAVTVILVIGIKEAAGSNLFMVVLKVAVIFFIIIVGFAYVNVDNWHPFIPPAELDTDGKSHYGVVGLMSGAAYVFFAFIGFDSVSTHAGEAKNPQKDVPFGIIVSLLFCTVLYVLVSLVLTGMVPYHEIDKTAPIAAAFARQGLDFAVLIISIAAVAGLTSVLIVMLLSQARVFYAMARDGLLPQGVFGVLHPKFRTPHRASILTGIVVAVVSALTPIDIIAKMVNIGTLLAFVMVCAAVWVMRRVDPARHRPFRTPWMPVVASLGIVSNLVMMLSLESENWLRLIVWLAIGFGVYFLYGKRHSKLGQSIR